MSSGVYWVKSPDWDEPILALLNDDEWHFFGCEETEPFISFDVVSKVEYNHGA